MSEQSDQMNTFESPDELHILDRYIEESRERFEHRRNLRISNSQENIDYPSESHLDKLDISIKKNSAFVKRLKLYTESQKSQVLEEIDRLNLTKFISEVAASLIDAKLKLGDIPSVIEICTKLNQKYREFNKQLLDQYARYFPVARRKINESICNTIQSNPINYGSSSSPNVGSIKSTSRTYLSLVNPSKIRVDLRLFAELISSGIIPYKDGFPILVNILCYLMLYDKNVIQNASAILTFCKGCGDEFVGLVPSHIQALAKKYNKELPVGDLVNKKRQSILRSYICDYHRSIQKHLILFHEDLKQLIIKNNKACKSKGEVNKELKESIDIKRSELTKVQTIVYQLADLLGEVPEVIDLDQINDIDKNDGLDIDLLQVGDVKSSNLKASQIWDDDGTRSFYENLLDLRTLFPNLSMKVDINKANDIQVKETQLSPSGNNAKLIADGSPDSSKSQISSKSNEQDSTTSSSSSSSESSSEDESGSKPTDGDTLVKHQLIIAQASANRVQPEQYFNKLSNCVNRDMIDNASIDFIKFYNTKFGRRKLVKTLFNVQRTRLDLLPFYARLTATIYPYVPRVGNELTSHLKHEFRNLFKKKDQINIESKVKNVRFIGELVKFNLYSKHEALTCLKMLLSDFTHHHIEMTCNLLETCGRLLYHSSESHHQMRLILEQMMRKKMHLSVDSKYVTMIENAYYLANPPEVIKQVVEENSLHTYIRYLLYECLSRSTIDQVVKKIRLLDWSDRSLAKFVINRMIEAYNLKFYNIRYLAALLATLNKDKQWISIAVIDGVVEDILLMMEINEVQFNQRRIPMIRYFGELYNYRLSDSSLVFKILYSLITYGILYPEPQQNLNQIPLSQLDPPDNLFRIKLICDLLDTCGQYLSSGQEKKKLDCYLLFFQRYYWYKKHIYMLHPYCMAKSGNQFPASTEYMYNDTILNLRPSFPLVSSYSDAIQALQNFINSLG